MLRVSSSKANEGYWVCPKCNCNTPESIVRCKNCGFLITFVNGLRNNLWVRLRWSIKT